MKKGTKDYGSVVECVTVDGDMVWMAISDWVISCLTVTDEIAGSILTGDIGPFHVS
ncbi:hypothetical protein HanPI659440_Chr06g0236831 [Helianthus annuus]|uniref:Uncharacterized protein n=1 Tax=Helianthus annuus TaxID=4232 RepID=A0A9K3JV24_HELAN|nr:hypothetical protein HanXRQr2_Chr15g0719801 [Helianthus annuus]KAF5790873.1 hypothetical protein HanXRQr2_Chr09g0388201 [Helianthus annuus]KAF5821553.1 hypothetical protein HanXRQr2_Chr01g0015381 [Helianthus annuus]KAJ0453141.1 hypothetical protein HanHA300_Chr15g0587011 [Helianthus annuus]KAJ0458283.1 hypothetical protein HanIR_Chr15g0783331 [Helianthus annuus]